VTVTITGPVEDVTGIADNSSWQFASVLRFTEDGTLVTAKPKTVYPVAGILTVKLKPGPTIVTYGKQAWNVTVPDTDGTLKELIEEGIAFPPQTAQEALDAAVAQYVETNRNQFKTRAVPVTSGPDAGKAQWVDANDDPVGDPVTWDQVIGAAVAEAAATAAATTVTPGIVTAEAESRVAGFGAGATPGYVTLQWGEAESNEFPGNAAPWSNVTGKPIDSDGNGGAQSPYLRVSGGQSVTGSVRFVGRLGGTEGPPTAGTWQTGDIVYDRFGTEFRCAIGGSPGVWRNHSGPGFMDQIPMDQGGLATYVDGGPVTLSATPTTLPVHSASSFPDPGGTATDLIIGLGVAEGNDEIRYFATYTGKSGNSLTGVVMKDGSTLEVQNLWGVWYAKSGLATACLRVPNQITARGSFDGKAHDIILVAAYDDWRTVEGGRADYDIIMEREAGSYGQLSIRLPINFGMDMPFYDAAGRKLIEFAAGTDGNGNTTNPNPLPTLSIQVHGNLVGAQGVAKTLILKNSGAVNSQIALQDSSGTTRFGVDDGGPRIPNNTLLRFFNAAGNGAGSIRVTTSDTMTISAAGANGIQFNNSAGSAAIFRVTNAGAVIIPISTTPASAGASGTMGTIAWDANYLYVCTATNTWKRAAIATW
jgi:hypothetical protein